MTYTIDDVLAWLGSYPTPCDPHRRPTLYCTADMARYLSIHPRTLTRWATAADPGDATSEDITDTTRRRLWDADRIGYDRSRGLATLKPPSASSLWGTLGTNPDYVLITLPQLSLRTGIPTKLFTASSYPTPHVWVRQGLSTIPAWVIPGTALREFFTGRI